MKNCGSIYLRNPSPQNVKRLKLFNFKGLACKQQVLSGLVLGFHHKFFKFKYINYKDASNDVFEIIFSFHFFRVFGKFNIEMFLK